MKRFVGIVVAGVVSTTLLFAQAGIENVLASGELVFFVPSHGYLVHGLRFLYSHFYGPNFQQKWVELSSQSVAGYGVNILEAASLWGIGIHTNAPMAFVHVMDNVGYLALPVANRKTLENHIKKNLPSTSYRFVSNYLLLSQNDRAFGALSNRLLKANTFSLASSKFSGLWSQGWIWFESRYLSAITRSTGVSDKVNLPSGFGLVVVEFQPKALVAKAYTGALDNKQQEFLYQLQQFESQPRFDVLGYVRGNPLLLTRVSMNLSLLYRYYRSVDKIDIMGIAGLLASLKRDYHVDLERDLIHNSEGRFAFVVDRFQTGRALFYGAVGIKNKLIAQNLMESLKNMVLQKREELYAFEIFTMPFYHYKTTNSSFYFGVVENEFFFASDKDLLVQCIKDIYEKKMGNPSPSFFLNPRQRAGVQALVDVQTLLSTLGQDTGIRLAREFFVGMEKIELESYPDTTAPAYGWTTEIRMKFYK